MKFPFKMAPPFWGHVNLRGGSSDISLVGEIWFLHPDDMYQCSAVVEMMCGGTECFHLSSHETLIWVNCINTRSLYSCFTLKLCTKHEFPFLSSNSLAWFVHALPVHIIPFSFIIPIFASKPPNAASTCDWWTSGPSGLAAFPEKSKGDSSFERHSCREVQVDLLPSTVLTVRIPTLATEDRQRWCGKFATCQLCGEDPQRRTGNTGRGTGQNWWCVKILRVPTNHSHIYCWCFAAGQEFLDGSLCKISGWEKDAVRQAFGTSAFLLELWDWQSYRRDLGLSSSFSRTCRCWNCVNGHSRNFRAWCQSMAQQCLAGIGDCPIINYDFQCIQATSGGEDREKTWKNLTFWSWKGNCFYFEVQKSEWISIIVCIWGPIFKDESETLSPKSTCQLQPKKAHGLPFAFQVVHLFLKGTSASGLVLYKLGPAVHLLVHGGKNWSSLF